MAREAILVELCRVKHFLLLTALGAGVVFMDAVGLRAAGEPTGASVAWTSDDPVVMRARETSTRFGAVGWPVRAAAKSWSVTTYTPGST